MRFSGLRGERVLLGTGATVINDCYNANPLSMRAALDDLATHETAGRRARRARATCSSSARPRTSTIATSAPTRRQPGVDVLVTVGPRAARMLDAFDGEALRGRPTRAEAAALAGELVAPGDVVLVKGSRGVGLETGRRGAGRGEG